MSIFDNKPGKHEYDYALKIQKNMSVLNQQLADKKNIENLALQENANIYKESVLSKANNSAISNRHKSFILNTRKNEALRKNLLSCFLTETVIKGLVFDDYFVEKYKNGIITESNKIIGEMFEKGILTENHFKKCNNIFVQDAYNEISNLASAIISNPDKFAELNESVYDILLNEAPKTQTAEDEIAGKVKEKVGNTIKREKAISDKKKEEKEAADAIDDAYSDDKKQTAASTPQNDPNAGGDAEEQDALNAAGGGDDEQNALNAAGGGDGTDPNAAGDNGEQDALNAAGGGDDGNVQDNTGAPDTPDLSNDPNADGGDNGEQDALNAAGGGDGTDPNAAGGEVTDGQPKKVTINVKNGSTTVNIISEGMNPQYFNFTISRWKEATNKSIFRSMFESNMREAVALLKEDNSEVNLNADNVLGETIVQYTLLETLYTSKLFDLNARQLDSLRKTLVFNDKNK